MMICLSISSYAQDNFMDNFFEDYSKNDDATELNINGGLLKFVMNGTDEAGDLVEKISKVRLLFLEEGGLEKSVLTSLKSKLRKSKYEDLMQIRDGGDRLDFMLKEKNNKITDVILFFNDDDSFGVISIEGLFDFSDLKDINLNIEGGNHFNKIPKEKGQIPGA